MPRPFIWHVNYYSTVNNEGRVGIFVQNVNFRKFRLKCLKNNYLQLSLYFIVEDANHYP